MNSHRPITPQLVGTSLHRNSLSILDDGQTKIRIAVAHKRR
jgi:hypothetical protein